MSEPPTKLDISNVTSRSFDISWMKPTETYSAENYGYVLQIKDDQDKCVIEIIYRCSDCTGRFQISNLNGLCSFTVRSTIDKTKQQLEGQLSYLATLNPDIAYTVTVTAINDGGRGYPANKTERTLEEAPQSPPYNVEVSDIETTSFRVSWEMDEPRPGQTNFTITVYADKPATTKEFSIKGFTTRSFVAQGLEEYWSYSVTVTAATSVGAKTSDATLQYRTLPAAPGKVSNFEITAAPGGNYAKMQISWNAPDILQRNGVIKDYSLIYFSSKFKNTPVKKILAHTFVEYHMYTATVDVVPGEIYSVEVYATNEQDLKGASTTKFIQAPTKEKSRTGSDCDGAKNSIIIGIVLGALLLIVSIYAGYATLVIRRYKTKQEFPESSKARTKERRGPIYGNETFMIGETEEIDSSDPAAVRHSETEYTRLDDNTKDDKGTYDIIQAM
ncbi:receptor-type tyrosine-protein phosphatase F-like [Mercenaria mercenaria]|uniref:receptor-type tyrosine-protein phosphatase F-like n=1 Tax=Mercenaria mercenaria TaxID=6596 RepID=UPI00234F8A55|nr:receptor-type tyrosine-protein phosphatase F-like [Mercenaria mercenaria]